MKKIKRMVRINCKENCQKFFFFICALFFLFFLSLKSVISAVDNSNVVISQVLYDPEQGVGEAVEIYNPSGNDIDITGWTLATEASARDSTIPQGTILSAKQFYLIADLNWSQTKKTYWPNADHEETITLANSDSGIALRDNSNLTVDAVGWGDPLLIQNNLYEGTPFYSGLAVPGSSIQRKIIEGAIDTDNNTKDFYLDTPSLRNSQSSTDKSGLADSNNVLLSFTLSNSNPAINSVEIQDENPIIPGIQVNPLPGASRKINFSVVATDENGADDIKNITFKLNNKTPSAVNIVKNEIINSTAKRFTGSLDMNFYDAPSNYTLEISAYDASGSGQKNISFQYMPAIGIQTDAQEINFTAVPGKFNVIAGDKDITTKDKLTIQNIGNVNFDVVLFASNFSDSAGRIVEGSYLNYTLESENFNSLLSGSATAGELKSINLQFGESSLNEITLGLFVPQGLKNSRYTSRLSIYAIAR